MSTNRAQESVAPILRLHWNAYTAIFESIGSLTAETGGILGGNRGIGGDVTHFHFDQSSRNSTVTYSPDHECLNSLLKHDWNPSGIRFVGCIHSHPGCMSSPSNGDLVYAKQILLAIEDLQHLWLPIVNTTPDQGQFRLTPWVALHEEDELSLVRGRVQVTHLAQMTSPSSCHATILESVQGGIVLDEIVVPVDVLSDEETNHATRDVPQRDETRISITAQTNESVASNQTSATDKNTSLFDPKTTFDRVRNAYDLEIMSASRIFAVGTGGAAGWIEDMARAGLGQFVFFDPDFVSETNLATQQVYRRDIGRPKVDCIAERILDINPDAQVIALQNSLCDFSEEAMRSLATDPINGRPSLRTIMGGFTDNFFAQAQVNRLSLTLGLPSLSAQLYAEGRAGEVVFTYPGETPACQRCILSSRYKYFLEQHRENPVTSHGTAIFSTDRVNAIKGFVALAILHHGSDHPRCGSMVTRIGNRNLIQIRMDPDLSTTMKIGVFDRVLKNTDDNRLFFDEALWLPQDPEGPKYGHTPCPDCGGTGDLRDAVGSIEYTEVSTPELTIPSGALV